MGDFAGRGDRYSIRLGEIRALGRRLAADHAHPRDAVTGEWNYAASRFGLLSNPRLAHRIPAPIDVGESTAAFAFHVAAKRRVVVELPRIRDHRGLCLRVEIFLNLAQERADPVRDRRERRLAL